MKRKLLRIVICLLGFIFWLPAKNVSAQWVTIPDSNFVNWLNTYGFASCMNGNLMDTTCNAVVNATSVSCGGISNIQDLDGIQYFDNLLYLDCEGSSLTSLPLLPANLRELNCRSNNIPSINSLPDSLRILNCEQNYTLQSLPLSLPEGLEEFRCGDCPVGFFLGSFNYLPSSLKKLQCQGCGISNINYLPDSLLELNIYGNYLSYLPELPGKLKLLYCSGNNLDSLPQLPASLTELYCSGNNLTSFPQLPASLIDLYFDSNQISIVPQLPPTLKNLVCNNNLITSLPEFPTSMEQLVIDNNPSLHCIPKLKTITNNFSWANTGISCLPNYGNIASANPPINSVPLCQIINQNNCGFFWNISGRIFSDSISNCLYDSSENVLGNINFQLFQDSILIQKTISDYLGYYAFDTDSGNYSATVDTTDLPFYVSCPPSGFNSCYLPSNDSIITDKDFGVVCKPGFDVGANAVVCDSGLIRPANYARIHFYTGDLAGKYGLHCASGISGTVSVVINGPASYVSSVNGSLTPTISGDTLLYTIADFGSVNFYSDFGIIIQTDTTAQAGNQICFDVSVTPVNGDNVPSNNSLTHCFIVVNSYDPNLKSVYPSEIIDDKNGKLIYTIQFQNTGNAPAQHIYILDTLDAAIDESSFELLAYSHQPQVQVIGNVVKFNFPNINLPDSVNDEPESHGYVQYRVKLKDSLALGTVISNTSYIYFDFNAPVQTNTVVDTLLDCNLVVSSFNISKTSFCKDDTLFANVSLNDNAIVNWYLDNVLIITDTAVSIPSISLGNHILKTEVITYYCTKEFLTAIVFNNLPQVGLGSDTTVCNSLILDAGNGFTNYLWSTGETTQTIQAMVSSLYSVLVTDTNNCTNFDFVDITINPLPTIELGNDTSTCNIPVTVDAGAGFSTYQWSNGETTQTIVVNATANYSVVVTDSNGCLNADTVSIAINALPAKPTIIQNISLLTSSSAAGNQWLMNGSVIAGAINNTYDVTLTGWYSVMVTDSNGCSNLSDSIYMDLSGVSDVTGTQGGIRIVPNPATSSFVVWGLWFDVGDVVSVSDALGKVVYQVKIAQTVSNIKVETSGFNPGVYFVNVNTSEFSVVLKLVKE